MRLVYSGMAESAPSATRIILVWIWKRKGRMEKPELTFKIEMMGNLIYQLRYIQTQFEDSELDIVEAEFDRTMDALKEMKELV